MVRGAFLGVLALGLSLGRAVDAATVGVGLGGDVSDVERYKQGNTTALRAALLAGYDKHSGPPKVERDPAYPVTPGVDVNCTDAAGAPTACGPRGVPVYIQMALQQLTSISTVDQSIGMYAWWRHYWVDPRLRWNPADWGGVTEVTFVGSGVGREVWVPDFTLYDAVETKALLPDILVNAYSGGGVWVSFPITHKVPCPMDLRRFPFDIQVCKFTVGSWTLNGHYVDLLPKYFGQGDVDDDDPSNDDRLVPFRIAESFQPHTEYDMLSVKTHSYDKYYACCPEPYPVVKFEFELRRHIITYVSGILLPMVLSTFAGFCAFFVNPSSGERVTLGITVMLTNAAIYIVAFEVLPKGAEWTAITLIHIASFIFSLFTLIISLLTVSLYCVTSVSTGAGAAARETNLLALFALADRDQDGEVDKAELEDFVAQLGLARSIRKKLFDVLEREDNKRLSLEAWYDAIAEIYEDAQLAACHSWIVIKILVPLIHRERRKRKASVLQRLKSKSSISSSAAASVLAASVASRYDGSEADPYSPRPPPSRGDSAHGVGIAASDSARSVGIAASDSARSAGVRFGSPDVEAPSKRPRPALFRQAGLPPVPTLWTTWSNVMRGLRPPGSSFGVSLGRGRAIEADTALGDDVADPTEYVARKLAGHIDFVFSLLLPIVYATIVLVLCRPGQREGIDRTYSECTEVSHDYHGVKVWEMCEKWHVHRVGNRGGWA